MNNILKIVGLSFVLTLIAANTGFAQNKMPKGWYKTCAKQADNEICTVQIQIFANTGQILTSINLATITGNMKRRVFQITVPTGRLIPAGISINIDDNKPVTVPFLFCFADRCITESKLEDGLIRAMKAGGRMTVTSTNFQNKPNPIEVTLSGFTAAYDGPAIKPEELQQMKNSLTDKVKVNSDELRKKMRAEQEKAKSGG